MKIGVFVGSFNPVHKGHIKMINKALEIVDKVLVIPTGSYWNKINNVSIEQRIEMLNFYKTENIIIENKINNLQYTYQIIRNLKKRYKKDELFLILGADNIISFDKWKHYKELLKLNLIIFNRSNINVKYYLDLLNKFDNYYILNINIKDASSTKIRDNINNNKILEKYLDKVIIKYIKDNKLYI